MSTLNIQSLCRKSKIRLYLEYHYERFFLYSVMETTSRYYNKFKISLFTVILMEPLIS